jgi:hypothetical protein
MKFLTDLADQAVIIPMVLAVAVALFVLGWRRGAFAWLAVVGGTFATMLALKLTFLGCSPLFGPMDVHSPSGHVAAATVVSGGLAMLLTRRPAAMAPIALLAALVIGISRIWLGHHSLPEVVVGAIVGFAGAAILIRLAGPPPALRVGPMVATVVIVAALFHGLHLPAEAAIRHTAYRFAQFIPACRADPGMRLGRQALPGPAQASRPDGDTARPMRDTEGRIAP